MDKHQPIILSGPELKLNRDCSFGKYIFDIIKSYDKNIAEISSLTGKSQSYTMFNIQCIQFANEFRKNGIQLDDVISICSGQPEAIHAILGGIYAGATINPLDPSLNKYEIKHILNITTPKLMLVETSCLGKVTEVIEELQLPTIILMFNENRDMFPFLTSCDTGDIIQKEVDVFEPVNFTNCRSHNALLNCSSGTTGLPKCVAISHEALIAEMQILSHVKFSKNCKVLNMSSPYWITGIISALISIINGATRVSTPPFTVDNALFVIEKYQVNLLIFGTAYITQMITHKMIHKYDLKSVQRMILCGAKLSDKFSLLCRKYFPNAHIVAGYGLTECTGSCFQLNAANLFSIGRLAPGVTAKVCDLETGRTLGPNQIGELRLRGKIIFSEYYRNPRATAEAFDSDGFLHTGDLVEYDQDQFFYFKERHKELFKCRGWQISPFELELALTEHPEIEQAAVIGVPHEIDITRARAYIVRKNVRLTVEDIQNFMREKLNSHKQITGGYIFVDELPFTSTGKIKKFVLREMSCGQH